MALQLTPSKEQLEQLDKLAKIYGKDTKEEAIYCMLQWYLGLRDKNEQLKGIEFLDPLHRAIAKKTTLLIEYQSFKAKEPLP